MNTCYDPCFFSLRQQVLWYSFWVALSTVIGQLCTDWIVTALKPFQGYDGHERHIVYVIEI